MRAERNCRRHRRSGLVVLGVGVGYLAVGYARSGIVAQLFVSAPGKHSKNLGRAAREGSSVVEDVAEGSRQEWLGNAGPSLALLAPEGESTSLQPVRFGLPLPSPAAG